MKHSSAVQKRLLFWVPQSIQALLSILEVSVGIVIVISNQSVAESPDLQPFFIAESSPSVGYQVLLFLLF